MLTSDERNELEQRQRQLRARMNRPGFKGNCIALQARIDELQAKDAQPVDSDASG